MDGAAFLSAWGVSHVVCFELNQHYNQYCSYVLLVCCECFGDVLLSGRQYILEAIREYSMPVKETDADAEEEQPQLMSVNLIGIECPDAVLVTADITL